MNSNHTILVNQTVLKVSASGFARVWKNNSGVGQVDDGRYISYGLPGSPDILGILKNGKFLGIECKTGSGKLGPKQVNFQNMVARFQGVYIVCREGTDIIALVRAAAVSK